MHVTPADHRRRRSPRDWFDRFEGAGLDGVVAKPLDEPYLEGKRTMQKVKHLRTADCVVAGYRVHKDGEGVGLAAPRPLRRRRRPAPRRRGEQLRRAAAGASSPTSSQPLEKDALDGHPWRDWGERRTAQTGAHAGRRNRWNAKKDMSWVPLRIERVAEVAYEHLQGDRFRHTARFQRWRPDRDPASCTYEQLDVAGPRRAPGRLRRLSPRRASRSGGAGRPSERSPPRRSSVAGPGLWYHLPVRSLVRGPGRRRRGPRAHVFSAIRRDEAPRDEATDPRAAEEVDR